MKERIAIIEGIRSPFAKAGTALNSIQADDLGAMVLRELMARSVVSYKEVGEVIIGNVAQPGHAANISRVVALKAGFPISTPAVTVHRNCASGMESITTAAAKLLVGESEFIVAGGTESMSNIPLLFNAKMRSFFERLMKAKTPAQKLSVLTSFRLSFLKPIIGVMQGLTDPVSGLIMGLTAENLVKEFGITRLEQDQFALESHQKAVQAVAKLKEEMVPIVIAKTGLVIDEDQGPMANQSLEKLAKLSPYFEKKTGTVTVGNACPITDGAAMVTLCTESKAKALGLKPLGYLTNYAYAGLEPERMGLGPVYATSKVLEKTGLSMKDFDLIELNEAFAAQVIANIKAFNSQKFAETYLNRSSALGELDPSKLNVNGGAIALGHPVGATGARIVITILKELKRRNQHRGLATLCIGGGQGAALVVETE